MKRVMKRRLRAVAGAVSLAAFALASGAALAQEPRHFDIAEQPLAQALLAFNVQSGAIVMASSRLVKGHTAPAVKGRMAPEAALRRMLAGTGLALSRGANGNFMITEAGADRVDRRGGDRSAMARMAQAQRRPGGDVATDADARAEETGEVTLEEMIVTGSNIRGAATASPVVVFDRDAIELTGRSTLPDFLRTVPQVFGGGASENNSGFFSDAANAGLNIGGGSGVNLRGLGTDSTLVLLDGRRMAPAGFGEFVDISTIPVTAIERVEVLTDGASAIYGSDAVGGVVNIILRDDFEGAETGVRYGTVTEGDNHEVLAGQALGARWAGGGGLISYEFRRRSDLDSNDRDFTRDSLDPTDLLPRQTRHGVFANAEQRLTPRMALFGRASYSHRRSEDALTSASTGVFVPGMNDTEQYGGSVGLTADVLGSWQAEIVATYDTIEITTSNQTFLVPFSPGDAPVAEGGQVNDSDLLSVETKADGVLLGLPGGEVSAAFGGQFRRETFSNARRSGAGAFVTAKDLDRDIFAVFGELFVPLVGQGNAMTALRRLELTVAARYEDYDDFGSTTDPKVGLLWSPVDGLNLRGTFGTSFRAPLLNELSETNRTAFLFSIPDPDNPDQTIPGMLLLGNNAELGPETATTWTAGLDWTPQAIPGFSVTVTYFSIDFDNRIAVPNAFLDGFADPRFASLVTRDPDPEFIARLTSLPNFRNLSPFDPADTRLLFDRRLRNLASVQTRGLDLSVSHGLETAVGSWTFTLDASYLFEQSEQLLATTAPVDVVDTVNNPADLRLNGAVTWSRDGLTANLRVNHTGAYRDVRVDPVVGVDSWTTADVFLSYDTEGRTDSPWLKDTVFSFSVRNLLNEEPPFVTGLRDNGINFDPDNASALGRFIAFEITRNW